MNDRKIIKLEFFTKAAFYVIAAAALVFMACKAYANEKEPKHLHFEGPQTSLHNYNSSRGHHQSTKDKYVDRAFYPCLSDSERAGRDSNIDKQNQSGDNFGKSGFYS
jgi:hypothetical protein